MTYKYRVAFTLLALLLMASTLYCNDLSTTQEYDTLLYYQRLDLQDKLIEVLPISVDYYVTGPLDPTLPVEDKSENPFLTIRIVGYNDSTSLGLSEYFMHNESVGPLVRTLRSGREIIPGYRGKIFEIQWNGDTISVQFLTTQQNRLLIWYGSLIRHNYDIAQSDSFEKYSRAVSNYLMREDDIYNDPAKISAANYGLPAEYDLYAEPPGYVIDGYQNYKDFLYSYSEIKTEFAHGITAFVPTDETLRWFEDNAPHEVFPNKEAARLQEEYSEFFRRGGDVRILQTLTKVGFDTLKSGEYFFAVGINGKIRFGLEMPRGEVRKIEDETGQKVPRANHAFLFPGESILTAGAFFIDDSKTNKLVKVNAQSGHYFYSNIAATIREDIAERSDYYLLTLGHFFKELDRLGIPYDNILISKF